MDDSKAVKILAVDSSTLAGSVALCEVEILVVESLLNVRSTHSENLLGQIETLLAAAGWALDDLDLLAAVTGPGSFTGLRIGIATVKGLAQVLERPVVGVSSLQTLAMNAPLASVPVCAFLDARKKEVYTQLFDCQNGLPQPLGPARVVPPAAALEALKGEVLFVGSGVAAYRTQIEELMGERALLPPEFAHQVRASQAAWLTLQCWPQGLTLPAGELLPTYIRPSDAELQREKAIRS